MNNRAVILLSGGLDSLVALSETINFYNIRFALFFNYGQDSEQQELLAAREIAEHYNIKLVLVKLEWFKNLLDVGKTDWVPNRNGIFINIAAGFAERLDIANVIIGINKEEGAEFKDNTKEFLDAVNNQLKHSTQNEVKVVAPLINYNKEQIVKSGINNGAPLEKIYSCYLGKEKHCGDCKSCRHLKAALEKNGQTDLINQLF
ncbi:7-cyano-7-deazaguanine synthase [bacterium]|nr:7-cyano-7-deazaguanine synthase [bacterium]